MRAKDQKHHVSANLRKSKNEQQPRQWKDPAWWLYQGPGHMWSQSKHLAQLLVLQKNHWMSQPKGPEWIAPSRSQPHRARSKNGEFNKNGEYRSKLVVCWKRSIEIRQGFTAKTANCLLKNSPRYVCRLDHSVLRKPARRYSCC